MIEAAVILSEPPADGAEPSLRLLQSWLEASAERSMVVFLGDVAFYVSPFACVPATLAVRLGSGRNVGTTPFYQTRTLGAGTNLRGYRSTPFSGTGSLYQNTEVRLTLIRLANYFSNNDAGLLGFFDA